MTGEPHGLPDERTVPLPMVVGVGVLAVLALVLLLLVLTRGPDGGTATVSPSPLATAGMSGAASPSASAEASPSAAGPTASADAPASDLATDTVVATTVEGLTVRDEPGLDSERLGTLELGALSYLAGGPTDADGFGWYLVSALGLPPNTGCAGELETEPFNCPVWFGWVAGASEAGEPWLVAHDLACPEEPYSAENLAIARTGLERLACFGSDPITFRGWWPELPGDAAPDGECAAQDEPSGWLLCQNTNPNLVVVDETEDFDGLGLRVSIDPASGGSMPERGTWIEVTAHLDDAAADGCDEAAEALEEPDRPSEQYVLDCRAELVLEAVQAVDGP
jgi:hypothetical protein